MAKKMVIPEDEVYSWLNDILDNSAGFDYSFNKPT